MTLREFRTEHHATYDPDVDAAYIQLADHISPGEAVRQEILGIPSLGEVILDFDRTNRLLGIEVLGAASLLPSSLLGRLGVDPPQ